MLSVDMSLLWGDETEKIVAGVTDAINNIMAYRNSSQTTKQMLLELKKDIRQVCKFWAGGTYVGIPKEEPIKEVYQKFFVAFLDLLLLMKNSKKWYEKRFAKAVLYQGTIYRYLGYGYLQEDAVMPNVVMPNYDGIYVSWSKKPRNGYFERKFYSTITWLECEIPEHLYGIDFDALRCSTGEEHEVVFPTIEECITDIRYIRG